MGKHKILYALLSLSVLLLFFQNCAQPGQITVSEKNSNTEVSNQTPPDNNGGTPPTGNPNPNPQLVPTLVATAIPQNPMEGTAAVLRIQSQNVKEISYQCVTSSAGVVKNGTVIVGNMDISLTISQDVSCSITAQSMMDNATLNAAAKFSVDCGHKVKAQGQCQEFACLQVRTLGWNGQGTLEIPARTSEGICYAVQLLNPIANSKSNLTPEKDLDVYSRNHDNGTSQNKNDVVHPYSLGQKKLDFKLLGARTVNLAGGANATQPILVDNYILSAIYLKDAVVDDSIFKAYGTSDATIYETGAVKLRNTLIPLTPFRSSGTSEIAPLNLTSYVEINKTHTFELKALDCGGARELSAVYLLFR